MFTRLTLPLVISKYFRFCIFISVLWCTHRLSLLSVRCLGLIIRLAGAGLSRLCMLAGRWSWLTRFWSRVWLRGTGDSVGGMGCIFYLFSSQYLLVYSIQNLNSFSILYYWYWRQFLLNLNVTMVLSKIFSLLLFIFKFNKYGDTSLLSHFISPKVYITVKNNFY